MSFYGGLYRQFPWFSWVLSLFTLAMIVYLFDSRMDASAKLTWMLMIAVVPIPAAAFLLFSQTNVVHRKLKKRLSGLIAGTKDAIPQDPAVLQALQDDGSGTDDLRTFLNRSGCFPVYGDTEVKYFPSGEEKFAALLEELRKAERYIWLEYFIIEEGYMWGEMLRILVEKARAGVDVRVLYDGLCELSKLPVDYWKLLEKEGIRARSFSPLRPVVSTHYNYRDHRKILVIDGKVAFNGGVNLADEYINRVTRFGHWKDVAVMLRGNAAKSFALMFAQMWNIDEKEPSFPQLDGDCGAAPGKPSGYVMPFGDSPLDGDKAGETVYMDILGRADRYVHIMTPYLILDGELETALKYAAQRGIDVKLIVPGIPDQKLADLLAKAHYRSLTEAGVRIYEYTPGFVHGKVFVSDDARAVVGTINLDYRSLYHHFECATYLYRADCVADIERDFEDTLAKSSPVTGETIRAQKLGTRIAGSLLRFIAPLL